MFFRQNNTVDTPHSATFVFIVAKLCTKGDSKFELMWTAHDFPSGQLSCTEH